MMMIGVYIKTPESSIYLMLSDLLLSVLQCNKNRTRYHQVLQEKMNNTVEVRIVMVVMYC